MLTIQPACRQIFLRASRRCNVVQSVGRRSMMAFEDHARLRGKFEEDRYLQQQEEKWREHMRELRIKEENLNEQRLHEQVVEPVKKDFANLLAKTGDKISEEGLENLAKSRLNF